MASKAQLSFSAGEISPSVQARADLVKYQTGLKTCRNFLVQKFGGVCNRPGTHYIAEVKDSTKATRLIPFFYNDTYAYFLEFGHLYVRFYWGDLRLVAFGVAWDFTATYPIGYVVTSAGTTYVSIQGNNLNHAPTDTAWWYPVTGTIYEWPTPWASTELDALQFAQSLDVLTITSQSDGIRKLTRHGHDRWSLSTVTLGATIGFPSMTGVTGSPGSETLSYTATAVDSETGEESGSGSSATAGSLDEPSPSTPATITWNAVTGASSYRVYRYLSGIAGFVGVAVGTSFIDRGYTPDFSQQPPITRNPFSSSNHPAVVSFYQQRLLFANTVNNRSSVVASQTGLPNNFNVSVPLQDTDAVTFSLFGNHEVRHLLDVGGLLMFTNRGVHVIEGNSVGTLTPSGINPKQKNYSGSSTVSPVVIGDVVLYVQSRNNAIRDLGFDLEADGYRGNDLTIFATHLFEGCTIVELAFQENPHSILWVVCSDGRILGLTYIREHQVWGWHRHETDGLFERAITIPRGTFDALYVIVNRTINGSTKRYIERFDDRDPSLDQEEGFFVDCGLSYHGWNAVDGVPVVGVTMTLSGGVTWDNSESLTLTASAAAFSLTTGSGSAGNVVYLELGGVRLRCTILSVTNNQVCTVQSDITVPVAMRNTAISVWAEAVDQVGGLDHLEGETVAICADGDTVDPQVVTGGVVSIDPHAAIIHVGLPYTSDLETLDLDTPSGSIANKRKLVTEVTVKVERSRHILIGPDEDHLKEWVQRDIDGDQQGPIPLYTGQFEQTIQSTWNSNGRLLIRQDEPLPLSVLAVIPTGIVG